ncbi:hypothetical protein BsIDN1_67860 [Bacillus safensis]|uniref:Uncharacterized protein n=1 Tax=Bacillus safensis TaxID=561879 RepID=A0A5S9MJ81_BACIA|nr:hypothetical protein BsIDN1_67860 [Bacillus safensis]
MSACFVSKKENAKDLKGMYRLLGELVHNVKFIQHLIACDTFEDMLDIMYKKKFLRTRTNCVILTFSAS